MTDPGATVGGVMFVLAVFGFAVLELAADRRLPFRVRQLVGDPQELGRSGSVVTANVGPDRALVIATRVVAELAGRPAKTYDGFVVLAWKGWAFTNIPKWAPYQVVAAIRASASGGSEILCGVRPRYKTEWLSEGYANKLSRQLASAMASAVATAE